MVLEDEIEKQKQNCDDGDDKIGSLKIVSKKFNLKKKQLTERERERGGGRELEKGFGRKRKRFQKGIPTHSRSSLWLTRPLMAE